MSYRTDKQRVLGPGSAKEGTGHWWSQRLTSIALIPLTILFIGVTFLHLQQGVQVVIEDYVHDPALKTGALLANTLLTWAFGLSGVFAVAKIAFTA